MKALLKRMLRPFYRATKKVLRPIAVRIRGPLSRILYPPEFETVFRNLEQVTNNLKGFVDQSDQMLLAMFRTLHLPPGHHSADAASAVVNLGNGRILAKHPVAPFLLVDASDLRESPWMLLNRYQPHVTEALRRLVRPGDCCVDLGAGIGYHTLTMAVAAGRDSRNFAIELEAHRAALLRDNLTATEPIATCDHCPSECAGSAKEGLRWLNGRLATRGGVPDFVRVGPGFDVSAAQVELGGWARSGSTRFLLSTRFGWAAATELREVSFWRIAADGSLFRATLAEIEALGMQQEVHFIAAKTLQ